MKRLPLRSLVVLLALGCSAPAGRAAPTQDSRPVTAETIRFGDPKQEYGLDFFPGASHDRAITSPSTILGQLHGSRLARHAEILGAFERWNEESDRLRLFRYGRTHEGRDLVYAVITSPANHARLEEIRTGLGRLADPEGLSEAEADALVADSPACAWLGYSIHGDELSGADASLAVAYHLVAGQGDEVERLLEELVIVVDPCMNPDGRERIVSMVEQMAGYTPTLDYAAMQRGRWPHGRGNHYLFDMNRDWMAGTQPETRGRWVVARAFHPQLFVDAHEMGSLDTFLFYPQNRPLNPELPPDLGRWQRRYAEDAAAAFDAHGWSYYTREWADAWAPFYSDAWGSLIGAVGMLYEQAGIEGFPLRRASGEVITYRETVHHQVVASMANLGTLQRHRSEVLASYLANAHRNVDPATPGNDRMFVLPPQRNADRERELLRILDGQGIEHARSAAAFEGVDVESSLGRRAESRTFPAGSLVVAARQPAHPRVRAFLGFDPRMPEEDLVRERESLERKNETRIYDVTAWSLAHALDLEAYWCDAAEVELESAAASGRRDTQLVGPDAPAVAWAVDGALDRSVAFAVRALEDGLAVHACDTELPLGTGPDARVLPRGTLVVRAVENGGAEAEARVLAAASAAGVAQVHRLATGLTPDATSVEAPDLGGGHFHLLARPRVAILGNAPVSADTFGHLWHHLDRELGVPTTMLDAQSLGYYDLRRYNVLIVPPGGLRGQLEAQRETLEDWVEDGGTLIAAGTAAAALTEGGLGLSSVVLRRDALEDLGPYRLAQAREAAAREVSVDLEALFGSGEAPGDGDAEGDSDDEAEDPYATQEVPEAHDSWLRRFSPEGVTLRGLVDRESWLTFGCGEELPAFVTGSRVLLSEPPVRTAVRLAGPEDLRLGGLLWPEARERLAHSAWLTREGRGNGQVILFASPPAYRGYHHGTARLFANAVVLGPGLGASQPLGW